MKKQRKKVFESGFLGTKAFMFMDIVTLYFIFLPLLVFVAIFQAIKKNYKMHYILHMFILVITIIMVIIFEVGVRFSGGYMEYLKYSDVSKSFFTVFLITHILIALLTVISWIGLILSGYHKFKTDPEQDFTRHKKYGYLVFGGILITSIMGSLVYWFLFI